MTHRVRPQYTRWTHLHGLRVDAGLTRAELAAEMGVSYAHLCQVEQGRARAGDALLINLARRFRLAPSELLATMPATKRQHSHRDGQNPAQAVA